VRRPFLACCGVALCAGLAAADTYPRQAGVDVEHYRFGLSLADGTDEIAGAAVVTVRFTVDGLASVILDLATPSAGRGMTVLAVTADGAPARFEHAANRLRVDLGRPSKAGDRRALAVNYRGRPASGLRIGANKHGERTFFSDNWPDKARQWLPTVDHPSDKATSEFLVNAPSRYQVVSNGLLREETDLGGDRRLTHWKQSVPVASWLNALGVARFASRQPATWRGVPFQTWAFPQDRDAGIVAFEEPSRRAFEFFSDFIGPYPFEKLAAVEAAGIDGGMELAGTIFYGEASVDGRPATDLVAHEVAHQWFGDSVTENDWDDIWLSEGFATYFANLAAEHHAGRPALVARMKRDRDLVRSFEVAHPGLAVQHANLADLAAITNPLVYQKGGWVLHMLRGRVGDEAFRLGIRAYYRQHRDANASTADFRRSMEAASGTDLAGFFDQWLRRPGSPRLAGTWRHDPTTRRVALDLEQLQPGDPYRLPLEVGLGGDPGSTLRVAKVEMTLRRQHFEVDSDRPPSAVELDPNTWTLMDWRLEPR